MDYFDDGTILVTVDVTTYLCMPHYVMLRTLGEVRDKREQKRTSSQQRAQIAEFDLKNEILKINGQIKQ